MSGPYDNTPDIGRLPDAASLELLDRPEGEGRRLLLCSDLPIGERNFPLSCLSSGGKYWSFMVVLEDKIRVALLLLLCSRLLSRPGLLGTVDGPSC